MIDPYTRKKHIYDKKKGYCFFFGRKSILFIDQKINREAYCLNKIKKIESDC